MRKPNPTTARPPQRPQSPPWRPEAVLPEQLMARMENSVPRKVAMHVTGSGIQLGLGNKGDAT